MPSPSSHPDARINYLLEDTGVGTWECDHATGRLTHNGAFISSIGLAPALIESLLEDWLANVHPEDREHMRKEFLAAAPRFDSEYRVSRPGGAWLWVNVRGRVLERDGDGRILRSAGTVTDISKRKHAEILLQIQHDFAGILLDGPDRQTLFQAILDSALRLPGLDGGGIYWRHADGGYGLVAQRGLSPTFVAAAGRLAPDSPQAALIRTGQLTCSCSVDQGHCTHPELVQAPTLVAEGICSLVVLPITVDGEILACLNLASRIQATTPASTVTALETLTRQFAQAISRLRAREEARHREDNLAGLFGALDDYVFVVALDGCVLHYNRAVAEGLGYGDTLRGRPLIEVHPVELRGEALRVIGEILADRSSSCPLPLLRTDGSMVAVDTRIVKGYWNGQPAIFGVSRDITLQLRQEAALGDAMRFSDGLINSLPGIYFLIDDQGRMARWNRQLGEVAGYTDEQIARMRATDFFAGDDVKRISKAIEDAFRIGEVSIEGALRSQDRQPVPYLFTARRTEIGGQTYIGGLGLDIT